MNESQPLLSIESLNIDFMTPSGVRPVLCDVNLVVHPKESVALIGESGCGKSVTAHAILGLLNRNQSRLSGQISFRGETISNKNNKEMQHFRGKRIGMIFQEPMSSLNPTLKIGRQIAEMLIVHENCSARQAQNKAIELLNLVGIPDPVARYHSYPFHLSGGMLQRVMIAIALACNPALLIADEPTTALDMTIQAQILELIRKIKSETGMALLLISHDLGVVGGLCDRIAVMHQGTIVETADAESLFTNPKHEYTRTLINAWQSRCLI